MKTRLIAPNRKDWVPHGYQLRAIDHLCSRGSAALFLDPGMGKTAVTLAAFCELQDAGIAQKMLVIAPVRVCQLVWRQEAEKWTQFSHLRIVNMAGKSADERRKLLDADADVWLINPESVTWLCEQFQFQRLPFDTLVIDELTKFKNTGAVRSKKLHPLADKCPRRWGLTGTPVPNGYMDLFGQMRVLDGGASLGRYITHYLDRFFQQGRDGFSYVLRKDADKAIEALIEPYVFRASSEDYLTLPPLIEDKIELELPSPVKAKYKQMKRDMILKLENQTITAANAAATYNKLQQLAGGAIYTGLGDREFVNVHDLKIDALIDLIEELQGKPLLVAYAYDHERQRITEALKKHFGSNFGEVPHLGGGVSARRAEEIERAWNAGELPVLLCHPASAGHGLNMQLGGASHLCWFTQTWDYELYEQFIKRVHRQGNSAERIVMHKLIVKETIDELVEDALETKATTQDALLAALKSEFVKDDPSAASAFVTTAGAQQPMSFRKLQSPGLGPVTSAPAPAPAAARGWGTPQGAPTAPTAPQAPAQPRGWGAPPQEVAPVVAPAPEQNSYNNFTTDVQQAMAPPTPETWGAPESSNPPFDGGTTLIKPPEQEKVKKTRAKKAETVEVVESDTVATVGVQRRVSFNVDGYLLTRMMNGGATFEQALEEVAIIVEGLKS